MTLSPAQLMRWRADITMWAEDTVVVRRPDTGATEPLQLADHQRAWLLAATERGPDGRFVHRTCVASWPKGEAKSLCVALVGAWRLTCFERQRIAVLANSESQAASVVFDYIVSIVRHSPTLSCFAPDDEVRTRRLRVPVLDSQVECLACNYRTVQGRRWDLLLCDELHAAEDTRAFAFASNQLEAADAQCLISSQAGAPVDSNPLWRLYQHRDEPHVLFDYREDHALPWAQAQAERQRKTLTPLEWDYMHRNSWGATGQLLFAPSDVSEAVSPYSQLGSRGEWQELMSRWGLRDAPVVYGIGLDRAGVGKSGDRTVLTAVARLAQKDTDPLFVVVRSDPLRTGSEGEVLEAVGNAQAIAGSGARVMLESYGCSDLVDKIRCATLEHPTAQRQQGLFNRLHRLLSERRLRIPSDTHLLKQELLSFEYDCERGGMPRFGTQRGHDDTVYSLAWACEAADSQPLAAWTDTPFQVLEAPSLFSGMRRLSSADVRGCLREW